MFINIFISFVLNVRSLTNILTNLLTFLITTQASTVKQTDINIVGVVNVSNYANKK